MNYSIDKLLDLYADANFYDNEFSERDVEIPFYQSQLTSAGSVLEVACGTGRLTIPLFESGLRIAGTDISPAMIAKATEKAKTKKLSIDFQVKEATQISANYDAIFIATNAFQHFLDYSYACRFLTACKEKLNANGIVIVDLQLPNLAKLSRDYSLPLKYKQFEIKGKQVTATIKGQYHKLSQIHEFHISYSSDGILVKEKQVAMRMYFPQELLMLFEMSGLKVVKSYGDYQQSPLDESAEKQIYLLSA